MDIKYSRVLKYCESQIDRTLKLFKKRKNNPPVPKNFPPLSGKRYSINDFIWEKNLNSVFTPCFIRSYCLGKVITAAIELFNG